MALVMVSPGLSASPAVLVACLFAVAVAFTPQPILRRRRVIALALVLVVLMGIGVVLSANSGDLILISPCRDYTSSDWQWWVYQCWQF